MQHNLNPLDTNKNISPPTKGQPVQDQGRNYQQIKIENHNIIKSPRLEQEEGQIVDDNTSNKLKSLGQIEIVSQQEIESSNIQSSNNISLHHSPSSIGTQSISKIGKKFQKVVRLSQVVEKVAHSDNKNDLESKLQRVKKVWDPEELKIQMGAILNQNGRMDEYIGNFDEKIQDSYANMKDYLDRRYIMFMNNLKKLQQRLIDYTERLDKVKGKIQTDDDIKRFQIDLENYQKFSQLLEENINEITEEIEQQSKANVRLTAFRDQQTFLLDKQNLVNIRFTDRITKLNKILHKLQKNKKRYNSPQQSPSPTQSIVQDYSNTNQQNISKNDKSSFILDKRDQGLKKFFTQINNKSGSQSYSSQAQLLTDRDISSVMEHVLQFQQKTDPIYRLELYCGSQKVPTNTQKQRLKKYFQDRKFSNNQSQQGNQNINININNIHNNNIEKSQNPSSIHPTILNENQQIFHIQQTDSSQINYNNGNINNVKNSQVSLIEYEQIKQETGEFKKMNRLLKRKVIEDSNKFYQLNELLLESISLQKKYLEKLQKVVMKDDGFASSLVFEINKQQTIHEKNECFSLHKKKHSTKDITTNLQEREIRNIVIDTLQNMWNKKYGSKKQQLKQNILQQQQQQQQQQHHSYSQKKLQQQQQQQKQPQLQFQQPQQEQQQLTKQEQKQKQQEQQQEQQEQQQEQQQEKTPMNSQNKPKVKKQASKQQLKNSNSNSNISFNFEWKTFREFTPMQIIGLMSMRPKLFEELVLPLSMKVQQMRKLIQGNKIISSSVIEDKRNSTSSYIDNNNISNLIFSSGENSISIKNPNNNYSIQSNVKSPLQMVGEIL